MNLGAGLSATLAVLVIAWFTMPYGLALVALVAWIWIKS